MALFLITSAVLLALLCGLPFWWAQGDMAQVPLLAVGLLAVGVLVSAVAGHTRRD